MLAVRFHSILVVRDDTILYLLLMVNCMLVMSRDQRLRGEGSENPLVYVHNGILLLWFL